MFISFCQDSYKALQGLCLNSIIHEIPNSMRTSPLFKQRSLSCKIISMIASTNITIPPFKAFGSQTFNNHPPHPTGLIPFWSISRSPSFEIWIVRAHRITRLSTSKPRQNWTERGKEPGKQRNALICVWRWLVEHKKEKKKHKKNCMKHGRKYIKHDRKCMKQ